MHVPPIAARQAGAFTRRQALEAGFARSTVRRRLAAGRWYAVVGTVLVDRGALVSDATYAWVAHLATGGVVSHATAARLHGLEPPGTVIPVPDARVTSPPRLGRPDGALPLHVVSRAALHVRVDGVTEHRVRLPAHDVTALDGLPVTTRRRTVVDLLATSPRGPADRLLFRAVQQRWLTEQELRAQLVERRGMTGTRQLRRLADLLGSGAHSVAELELHRILAGVPGADFRANVELRIGGERFVVDVLLPRERVVIEVDGRRFHSDADQFTRDRRRQNALVGAGYLVLRFTWLDLTERAGQVREAVLAAIAVSSGAKVARTGP